MSDATTAHGRPLAPRYYDGRREVLSAAARDAHPMALFAQLARAALPDVAQWVAVVDASDGPSFSECVLDHDHVIDDCAVRWARDLDIRAGVRAVLEEGETLAWPDDAVPHGVIFALVVEDRISGAVLFARDGHETPWSRDDLVAMHDVVTALGVDLERLRLRDESRRALRASQRVASQLHQLISASLAVGSLSDEVAMAQSLARSARSVFDAERALVSLHRATEPVVALAARGRAPRLLDEGAARDLGAPVARDDAREPWLEGDWLVAPVLDSQRRSRGAIAVARDDALAFGDEDRELAMLLGQLAATSLEALELNRTIQDNEARLRILVDAAPVAIVESNGDGEVHWWNRSASRLLRWPDFAGDAATVTWPSDVRDALVELWRDRLQGGLRDTHEFSALVGERERRLASSVAVLPSGGHDPHVLTLLDDITHQRELREEVRHAHRMELRGQVASTVAHDFNNLITLILGYSDLLARQVQGDEKSAGLVRDIQSTSSRAASLTAQLQSIGRTSEPAPVRLDVGAALEANAEVLERIMGGRNTVVWSLDTTTPPVMVDADLFEQMILNLSMNARDAMPEGGTLRFATTVRSLPGGTEPTLGANPKTPALPPGEYVVLAISDTGTGMDEATRSRCFEPLFTTKGPYKGTGLGLASARRLVEESGGVITCASRLGEGTTFTIWFPVPPSSDAASAPEAAFAAPVTRPRLEATVLLVEDDPDLRRLALQVLRRNGFVVHEAGSAEEALELRRGLTEPLDLLVSDIVLPGATGDALAAQLQREQPDLGVVLMSGTASASVIDALVPGSATFLAKPFTPSALVDQVVAVLSARRRD